MTTIQMVIVPRAKDLGDGFSVRRALPDIKKRMVGPFIFWDHMGPFELGEGKELKVRAHPHIGLATITYLFFGGVMHRDSLGNEQAICPGEVNWMTAGRGISHSERAPYRGKPETIEGIQLWVALPKEHEEVVANFSHFKEKDLPLIQKNKHSLRLIAGKYESHISPVTVYSDLFYLKGDGEVGGALELELKQEQEGAIYVINGELEIEHQKFRRYDLIIFKRGTKINLKSLSKSEFMFFGGSSFPEKRNIWWNFVSSDPAKIEKAKQEWKNKNFGQVINEDESIPLPE
jgi:redox-sensitive bicupin YhaK (pirin superfamily)